MNKYSQIKMDTTSSPERIHIKAPIYRPPYNVKSINICVAKTSKRKV